jgi:hypothetical protein
VERPILFSTAMVQAILEGKKTQTRRIIKHQPRYNLRSSLETEDGIILRWNEYSENPIADEKTGSPWGYGYKTPYDIGDILWVRETWCEYNNKFYYKADKKCYGCTEDGICMPRDIKRHVTCELCEGVGVEGYIRWKPSIHMPREAARLFLKVINVKVERLQSISRMDIKAEGIYQACLNCGKGECVDTLDCGLKQGFKNIWDSLNEKSGYGWDTNPWVWVIEFEKQ